jgi:hypothetical protein
VKRNIVQGEPDTKQSHSRWGTTILQLRQQPSAFLCEFVQPASLLVYYHPLSRNKDPFFASLISAGGLGHDVPLEFINLMVVRRLRTVLKSKFLRIGFWKARIDCLTLR